jgi:hypothetical protein
LRTSCRKFAAAAVLLGAVSWLKAAAACT